MEEDSKGTGLGNVIRIDDERVRDHLGRIVRGTVEETLNAMLEAEADRLCNAERYERTQARRDQRSGSYERKLQTTAGQVTLKVPKLRVQTFETAIIERYRRARVLGGGSTDRDVPGGISAPPPYASSLIFPRPFASRIYMAARATRRCPPR